MIVSLFKRLFRRRSYFLTQEELDKAVKKGRVDFRGSVFGSVDLTPYRGKINIQNSNISSVRNPLSVITDFNCAGGTLSGFTLASETVVTGLNFSKMKLDGCCFAGVKFVDCNFTNTNVKTSNFKGAHIEDSMLKGLVADSEGFTNVILTRSDPSQIEFADRVRVAPSCLHRNTPTVIKFEEKSRTQPTTQEFPTHEAKKAPQENSFWSNVGAIALVGGFIWAGAHPNFTEAETLSSEEKRKVRQKYERILETWVEKYPNLEPPVLKTGTTYEGIETACKGEVIRRNSYCYSDNTVFFFPRYTKERSRQFGVNYALAFWFTLNHEIAHALQLQQQHPSTKGSTKEMELEADCYAGMMMASQSDIGLEIYDEPSMLKDELSINVIKLGDHFFEHEDHHGTGVSRQKAFLVGYESQDCTNLPPQ